MVPGRAVDGAAEAVPQVVGCDPPGSSFALQAASCALLAASLQRSAPLQIQQQQQQRHCFVSTSRQDGRSDLDVSITTDHTLPAKPCRPITSKHSCY